VQGDGEAGARLQRDADEVARPDAALGQRPRAGAGAVAQLCVRQPVDRLAVGARAHRTLEPGLDEHGDRG